MKAAIDLGLAVIIASSLILGSGFTIKRLHDFIRRGTLIQISKGLSSSEKLANALTGEHFDKNMRLMPNNIKKHKN